MSTRTATQRDFEEFVAVCSPRLMRTAYLLTLDEHRAAAVTQDALAAASLAWGRLDIQPERFVRERVLSAHLGWGVGPASSAARERAVAVLLWWEGLTEEEVADELGCSVAVVDSVVARATAYTSPDQIHAAMAEQLQSWEPAPAPRVLDGVERGIDSLRVRRRLQRLAYVALLGALVVAALVLAPDSGEDPVTQGGTRSQIDFQEPRLLGRFLDRRLVIAGETYAFHQIQQSNRGDRELRVAFPRSDSPFALAWVSSVDLRGEILVTVDGDEVAQTPAGELGSGALLAPGSDHVVVLRATDPSGSTRIGLATYLHAG